MHSPKLVMIEGIPGSGKTSMARAAADWLGARGFDARLFLEGNMEHPADFESVACLSAGQFAGLRERFPGWRDALDALERTTPDGEVLIRFGKLTDPPADLQSTLSAHDVYNLPEVDFMRVTLARWREFSAAAAKEDGVYVFECCLLQNQTTTLMAVHDTPPERMTAHLSAIASAIAPLNPLVIYLEPPSVRAALERVAAERPPAWLAFVTAFTCWQAWGARRAKRGLQGFEGMVAFYEARRDLEKALFAGLFPRGLWIEGAGADWDQTSTRVNAYLADAFGEVG